MFSRTRVLLTASAVLAIGLLPLSNVAGATSTTISGSLPAFGSAQSAVPAEPGEIAVKISCTGKARITATIVDPSGTALASKGMACPRGGSMSAVAAGTFTLQLKETRGYSTTYTASVTTASQSTTTTTMPAPSTTTTTVPTATPSLLWSAGMENGSTSEWDVNGGGGLYNSGTYEAVASTDIARTGSRSLRASIWTPTTSGVRAFRWEEARANRSLYYSAWVYFPTNYTLTADPATGQFLNLFQFKSRTTDGTRVDPVWAMYAAPNGAGGLYLRAGWGWGGTPLAGPTASDGVSGKWYEPSTRVALPVGRWVHLEAFLHQSNAFDGHLTFWQDGTRIIDLANIRTSFNNCNYNSWCADNEWSVNLYSDGMSPNPAKMYIDDAAISTSYIP